MWGRDGGVFAMFRLESLFRTPGSQCESGDEQDDAKLHGAQIPGVSRGSKPPPGARLSTDEMDPRPMLKGFGDRVGIVIAYLHETGH